MTSIAMIRQMKTARWFIFALLLPIVLLLSLVILTLSSPVNAFFQPFCPAGFWRKPLIFGARFCAYTPISVLTYAIEFGFCIAVTLFCSVVLSKQYRIMTVRVLLLFWLCVPLVLALHDHLSWSLLAAFAVALFFWLALVVLSKFLPQLVKR
jgi:hypothetical protein